MAKYGKSNFDLEKFQSTSGNIACAALATHPAQSGIRCRLPTESLTSHREVSEATRTIAAG